MRTVPLALTTSLNAPDPRNAIHIVLEGIWPDSGEKGALMPGFEGALPSTSSKSLLAYLRIALHEPATLARRRAPLA